MTAGNAISAMSWTLGVNELGAEVAITAPSAATAPAMPQEAR